MFAFTAGTLAQPQHYNYQNVGGSTNSFPFSVTTGKQVQWLIGPGTLNMPGPVLPGNQITKLYFFMVGAASPTFTNITIRLGQSSITALPTGAWYTGQLDTVYYRASVNLTSTATSWMMITMDRPFNYDPTMSLIIEVSQCAASTTGMTVRQNAIGTLTRSYSVGGCPHAYQGQDGSIINFGVDVVPAIPPAGTLTVCRNRIGKVLNDHSTIRDTITVNLLPSSRLLDLTVRIDTLTHTWDSDVRAYISRGTIGTRMINGAGGSGDNFIGTNIKDSAALCQIGQTACNTPPFTGTFRPSIGYTFAPFLNTSPNFPWILTLTDTVSGDSGTLQAWCLVIRYDQFVGINGNNNQLPTKFSLTQNYPNPFNPSTTVEFSMPKAENVTMSVYDITGKEVYRLINNSRYDAGTHKVIFDMSKFASGVYFYKISSGSFSQTKKMILVK